MINRNRNIANRIINLWLVLLIPLTVIEGAVAEPNISACMPIIDRGLREYNIQIYSRENLDQVYKDQCKDSKTNSSSTFKYDLAAVINAIPAEVGLGTGSTESKLEKFCAIYKSLDISKVKLDTYKDRIIPKAYDTLSDCLRIVSNNAEITHEFQGETISFNMVAGSRIPINISGILKTSGVTCEANVGGVLKALDKNTPITVTTTQEMFCTRPPHTNGDPSSGYSEANITIMNNIQNYRVFWPAVPSDAIMEQAKSEANTIYKAKYEEQKANFVSLIPASITFWSWTTIPEGNNSVSKEAACPQGWHYLKGVRGPSSLVNAIKYDNEIQTANGYQITASRLAGNNFKGLLLIVGVECSPPKLDAL